MALAFWQREQTLPTLSSLNNLQVAPTQDVTLLGRMARLSTTEVERRLHEGNIPYVAWLNRVPAAYGWAARRSAGIGELGITVNLRPEQVYLWDFATLPEFRGQGIYPHLLQGMLEQEAAEQFWIIHAPENFASSRGINRAGFRPVGELSFIKWQSGAGLYATHPSDTAVQGAALLNVPLLSQAQTLASCWGCTITALQKDTFTAPACWSDTCCCTGGC